MVNANYMTIGTYAYTPNPVEHSFFLSSFIDLELRGGSTNAINNNVRTVESGGIRIRSEGLSHSFELDGRPVDWTTYKYALWTCRIRFEPPTTR